MSRIDEMGLKMKNKEALNNFWTNFNYELYYEFLKIKNGEKQTKIKGVNRLVQ